MNIFHNIVKLFMLNVFAQSGLALDFALDYTLANKNTKSYDQVPQNVLIFSKKQAHEPRFFPQGPQRGKGFDEPIVNDFINTLRKTGIHIYSDYFTQAKAEFYSNNINYRICRINRNPYLVYERKYKTRKNSLYMGQKYYRVSIPFKLYPGTGILGIYKSKLKQFEKHYFPNSTTINIKSLIDDETLKTIQVNDTESVILPFIYEKPIMNTGLKKNYKKRVYEFVASNADQITLMLNANRMDYVDMTYYGDFYQKKLGFDKNITFLPFTYNIELSKLSTSKEHLLVEFVACYSNNLQELSSIIPIINERIKKLRTNNVFLTKVLENFSKDFSLPNIRPEDFFDYQLGLKLKRSFDRGDFDLIY